LHGEAFRFEPFLQQGDLGGAAGAIHPFNHDEAAGDFAGIESDERLAKKILLAGIFGGEAGFDGMGGAGVSVVTAGAGFSFS